MPETVVGYAKAPPDIRITHGAFIQKSGLPTLNIKPAWHDQGFLIGFEVWNGPVLVGYIPYGKDLRDMLFEVGIG